jgi:endo-1,4-beta-xylanase
VLDHVSQICTRHKDAVAEWNTVHGAIEYFEIYNYIGVDCISQVFATARAAAPAASLLLSDIQALSALSDVPLRDTIELAEWLQQSGVQVDGVVLGANLKRLDVGPQSMEKRLDQLSARVKAPIHIANFAVNADSDEIQASMVRDYLLLFYSHPAVVSVSFAEPWAPAILNPRMAFYSNDFTPRPATETIFKLLDEEWRTVAELETDGTGAAPPIDAFIGAYEMTVTIGKETFPTVNMQLPPSPADSATPLKVPGAIITTSKTGVKVTLQVP